MAQISEILVHVSAGCRSKDDACYRAQAEAILAFDGAIRQRVYPPDDHEGRSAELGQVDDGDLLGPPLTVIPDSQQDAPCEASVAAPDGHAFVAAHQTHGRKRPRDGGDDDAASSSPESFENLEGVEGVEGVHVDGNTVMAPSTTSDFPASSQSALPAALSLDSSCLPLQIYPPPAPISSSSFSTHVTPALEMLATRLRLARTFQPVLQGRDLDKLERGCWRLRFNIASPSLGEQGAHRQSPTGPAVLASPMIPSSNAAALSCATWDLAFFSAFWSFLTHFIATEGRAGWGVWCILEEDDRLPAPSGPRAIALPVVLKVYTWGEVAPHIYLLLYLASERRLRRMGAQWTDATGQVVIQMA